MSLSEWKLSIEGTGRIIDSWWMCFRVNSGFEEQLCLYEAMKCEVDTSSPLYKQYRLTKITEKYPGKHTHTHTHTHTKHGQECRSMLFMFFCCFCVCVCGQSCSMCPGSCLPPTLPTPAPLKCRIAAGSAGERWRSSDSSWMEESLRVLNLKQFQIGMFYCHCHFTPECLCQEQGNVGYIV